MELCEGEESRCDRPPVLKEFKQQINTVRLLRAGGGPGGGGG